MSLTSNMTKNNSDHRLLNLDTADGKAPISSTGLIDRRLFTGEVQLKATMDETGLWSMKYTEGNLPEPLRQKFTSFSTLRDFAEEYFKKRNVVIKEVVNAQVE